MLIFYKKLSVGCCYVYKKLKLSKNMVKFGKLKYKNIQYY